MAEIRTIALEAVRQRGQADAQTLAERAVAGEADGTELTASQDIIPTWRQRDFSAVPIGTPPISGRGSSTSCGSSTTLLCSRTGRPIWQ